MVTETQPCPTPARPIVGVLAGAGPLIGACFQWEWLQAHQRATGAWHDDAFPGVISVNCALAGVDETGVADPQKASGVLRTHAINACSGGATHLIVACASLHAVLASIALPCPLIDWIALGAQSLKSQGHHRIGIVESQSSRRDGVFSKPLKEAGLQPIGLSEPLAFQADELIRHAMSGRVPHSARASVRAIEAALAPQCDVIWWGCTELSFVPVEWLCYPALRSLDVMVQACLEQTAVAAVRGIP